MDAPPPLPAQIASISLSTSPNPTPLAVSILSPDVRSALKTSPFHPKGRMLEPDLSATPTSFDSLPTHVRDALLRKEQRATALLALTRAAHLRSMPTMTRHPYSRRQARTGRSEAGPQ